MARLTLVGVWAGRLLRGPGGLAVVHLLFCAPRGGSRVQGAPASEWGILEGREQERESKELNNRTSPLQLGSDTK